MTKHDSDGKSVDSVAAQEDSSLYDSLWQVAAHAILLSEESLADTTLTPGSASVLMTIAAQPGISVAEISRSLPKTPQTISQVIGRLQKLDLVERRLRAGRGIGLHPTEAGAEMATLAAEREKQVDERLRQLVGADAGDHLARLLGDALTRLREGASA